ncbi:glycosyltransferase family 2 protein, partial [Escherichia coli]|uniref:glycosyltransferase family 2 protein n=4 Tax=Bacteria TaxID=2 RepID=UPI0037981C05
MPEISVIVPVYNVEKYLKKCVNSILRQTYNDFELILINDGSTDKSGEVCEDLKKLDPRIKVINKENGGLS